jgi:hypothetical protein
MKRAALCVVGALVAGCEQPSIPDRKLEPLWREEQSAWPQEANLNRLSLAIELCELTHKPVCAEIRRRQRQVSYAFSACLTNESVMCHDLREQRRALGKRAAHFPVSELIPLPEQPFYWSLGSPFLDMISDQTSFRAEVASDWTKRNRWYVLIFPLLCFLQAYWPTVMRWLKEFYGGRNLFMRLRGKRPPKNPRLREKPLISVSKIGAKAYSDSSSDALSIVRQSKLGSAARTGDRVTAEPWRFAESIQCASDTEYSVPSHDVDLPDAMTESAPMEHIEEQVEEQASPTSIPDADDHEDGLYEAQSSSDDELVRKVLAAAFPQKNG